MTDFKLHLSGHQTYPFAYGTPARGGYGSHTEQAVAPQSTVSARRCHSPRLPTDDQCLNANSAYVELVIHILSRRASQNLVRGAVYADGTVVLEHDCSVESRIGHMFRWVEQCGPWPTFLAGWQWPQFRSPRLFALCAALCFP